MSIYQQFVRKVLLPTVLWKNREFAQLQYVKEFERSQYLSSDQLQDLQLRRLRKLTDHAYRHCPFYRGRFDRLGLVPTDINTLADLKTLPALEKQDIQQHRDLLRAQDWPAADLIPNQTGGSTGTPLSFYLSTDRRCSRAAATIRHNRWAGWDIGDKVAAIWGAPQDRPSRSWRARLRNLFLDRHLFLDTGHLTEARMIEFHHSLKKFRPRVILAYARAAVMFARFLRARNLSAYQPHSIVTSAEVLEPGERALLEDVFGCPVFNRYGCREVSVIASECEHHRGLHIMAEGLYVEIESHDCAGSPTKLGSVLITDLLNFAMPLIRYRIGDMASWEPGPCPCGRGLPRLRQVAGRVTDFLVGSDGRLVSGVFVATYLVAQRPSLGQIQILQVSPGRALFRIKAGPAFRPKDDLTYLRDTARRYLGNDFILDHEFVKELAPEPSGKFLFCRSRATPDYCLSGSPG